MQIIHAKVNVRLLSKADRLFTGTIEGRIIEILQNARRAGASEVRINNKDGFVTVKDNGCGIEDFARLLDLGGSGWDEKLEAGEDPAGVGLFSLTPREVAIISGNRKVVIDKGGWTGKPVNVVESQKSVEGTSLKFKDEKPWDFELVEKHAVFTGMKVIVDGKYCHTMPFNSSEAVHYENPGCRIEVTKDISNYHRQCTTTWYHGKVLVNFHGQVVQLDYWPSKNRPCLTILVDIADQTEIRLMLPARTRVVENAALEKLKSAIELEYYRYFKKQKTHTLHYAEYLRARELGIELPEAEPQFKPGLIWDEYDLPVEVSMPKDFKLGDCYLCFNEDLKDQMAQTNTHLLAALGEFKDRPFVPVTINSGYIGYSWTNLPKVIKVEISKGKRLLRQSIRCSDIACFDKLSITVHTSDGKTYSSNTAMAVMTESRKGKWHWSTDIICVTKAARNRLSTENIWFHLGGYDIEGDNFDTQQYYIEKELQEFWNELIGPYETVRQQLIKELYPLYDKWQKVTILEDSSLEIIFKNGRKHLIKPPVESA